MERLDRSAGRDEQVPDSLQLAASRLAGPIRDDHGRQSNALARATRWSALERAVARPRQNTEVIDSLPRDSEPRRNDEVLEGRGQEHAQRRGPGRGENPETRTDIPVPPSVEPALSKARQVDATPAVPPRA
jgi:hypothetical protein